MVKKRLDLEMKTELKGVSSDLNQVKKGLKDVESQGKKSAKGMSKDWDTTFKNIRRGSMIAFAAIAGGVAASVKGSADIEYGWAKVSTMISGNATPALDKMKKRLSEIATLPTKESISGMQEAIYQLLSASVEADDVMDMLSLSLKLASAGFTETAVAADAVTGVLNAYSLGTEHAIDVADKLLLVQNRGKTTVGEYSQALGMVLPTAAKLGISFDEVGAAIASMTRQNIPARQAITSINAAMLAFINPTEQAKKIANEYGVELSLAKMQEMGFLKYLEYINVGLGGNAQKVAQATGQVEALKTVLALTGDQFNATQKDLEAFGTAQGTVTEGSETMASTMTEQFGGLKNELQLLRAAFGDLFLDDVKTATGNVKGFTKNLKEATNEHPALIKGTIYSTLALLGLTGGLTTFGLILPPIKRAVGALGAAFSKTGGFIKSFRGSIFGALSFVGLGKFMFDDFADAINDTADRQKFLDDLQGDYKQTLAEALNQQRLFTDVLTGEIDMSKWEEANTNFKYFKMLGYGVREAWTAAINAMQEAPKVIPYLMPEVNVYAKEPTVGGGEGAGVRAAPSVTFGMQAPRGVSDIGARGIEMGVEGPREFGGGFAEEIRASEDAVNEILAGGVEFRTALAQTEADARLEAMQEMYSGINSMEQGLMELTGALTDLRTMGYDNEIIGIKKARDAENRRWREYESLARRAGKADSAEYKRRQKEHEGALSSFATSESSAKRKAFEAERQGRMAGIVMSTAQAIMNAMASVPFPFSTIVAALAAATGAAQFATAAGQANPYHSGGFIRGRGDQMIMGEAGEYLIRSDVATTLAPVLTAMNQNRLDDAQRLLSAKTGTTSGQGMTVNMNNYGRLTDLDMIKVLQFVQLNLAPSMQDLLDTGRIDVPESAVVQ